MMMLERQRAPLTAALRYMGVLLPNPERAVVELVKLRDYCLDPDHEDGKHKARVFASALGIRQRDAEWLRDRLLEAAYGRAERCGAVG